MNCPHCGRLIRIQISKDDTAFGPVYSRPWTQMRPMADSARRFGDVAQPTSPTNLPEFSEATRDTPARAPSTDADVNVPWRRSLITGLLFGPVIGGALGILTPNVPFFKDVYWLLIITGGTVAGSWVLFLATSDSTLWIREKIINKDIDRDGHIGPPHTIRLEIHDTRDEQDRTQFINLPVPGRVGEAGLITFARSVSAQGDSFSERTAADHGYNREEWIDLRDTFVNYGWAAWNDPSEPRQGVKLLAAGRVILDKVSGQGMARQEWRGEG